MGPPYPSRRAPRNDCVAGKRTSLRPPQDEADQRPRSVLVVHIERDALACSSPLQALDPLGGLVQNGGNLVERILRHLCFAEAMTQDRAQVFHGATDRGAVGLLARRREL